MPSLQLPTTALPLCSVLRIYSSICWSLCAPEKHGERGCGLRHFMPPSLAHTIVARGRNLCCQGADGRHCHAADGLSKLRLIW